MALALMAAAEWEAVGKAACKVVAAPEVVRMAKATTVAEMVAGETGEAGEEEMVAGETAAAEEEVAVAGEEAALVALAAGMEETRAVAEMVAVEAD